ncbi:MAG: hypothetical protein IKK33_06865 [Lachnospiraceae bacterium]|nr:hypothetical protein [Lachnospiraceae bacterium]
MEELYKQEIFELTELLNEEWDDLKSILIQAGIDLRRTALASFMEDEDENEYGVLVNKDLKILQYERKTQEAKNNIENFKMFDITENEEELIKYPQIAVAIDMIKNGEIL